MKKEIEIVVEPELINDTSVIRSKVAKALRYSENEISACRVIKRSIDARPKNPVYRVKVEAFINEPPSLVEKKPEYKDVSNAKPCHIIGFGPAGMFAALRLIELGIKPIIYERGKNVRERRRSLKQIQRDNIVNPDSNYCFGEGGAGTYSDGKLYTRSTKRGDVNRILNILIQHGALPDIAIDSHPHIGSNKLPQIVTAIRETICTYGGEVHFNSKVTDFIKNKERIQSLIINGSEEVACNAVIFATGHSARDIYYLFNQKGLLIERKPFAVGVRIEHPQAFIDERQYHSPQRDPHLPASSYSLTCQVGDRGVFSFCMCPGGIIVPSATSPEEIVLNGMSVSKRNSPFANSGLVVTVNDTDFIETGTLDNLSGIRYQQLIEQKAFLITASQKAPAQRTSDFIKNTLSATLPKTSYIPGVTSVMLSDVLPKKIIDGLKTALEVFNKKMPGYISHESLMIAPETRTSSPVRITRNKDTLQHPGIAGVFPCGEGAGYAGGIVSAAIDGERAAEAVTKFISM